MLSGGTARRGTLIGLAVYGLFLTTIVLAMFYARRVALRELSTPEAQAQWQEWREAAPNQALGGPVKRRPPSSPEPPALVLLRDHFGVMLFGAILFGSLLFGALWLAARGAFAPETPRVGVMRHDSRPHL